MGSSGLPRNKKHELCTICRSQRVSTSVFVKQLTLGYWRAGRVDVSINSVGCRYNVLDSRMLIEVNLFECFLVVPSVKSSEHRTLWAWVLFVFQRVFAPSFKPHQTDSPSPPPRPLRTVSCTYTSACSVFRNKSSVLVGVGAFRWPYSDHCILVLLHLLNSHNYALRTQLDTCLNQSTKSLLTAIQLITCYQNTESSMLWCHFVFSNTYWSVSYRRLKISSKKQQHCRVRSECKRNSCIMCIFLHKIPGKKKDRQE